MVRARVLADAGASKSTGDNRQMSPDSEHLIGADPPPPPCRVGHGGWFEVSHQTHSEALPLRLWRLSDKPGDLTSLAAPSLLASCQ